MSGLPDQITDAIRDENPITEPQLETLHRFTRILIRCLVTPYSRTGHGRIDCQPVYRAVDGACAGPEL
jgi:hypothetical protein